MEISRIFMNKLHSHLLPKVTLKVSSKIFKKFTNFLQKTLQFAEKLIMRSHYLKNREIISKVGLIIEKNRAVKRIIIYVWLLLSPSV